MTGKGRVEKEAPRGAILYARLLWTFSAAYRVLKHTEYLNAATMTKDYILAHFMDKEYGGTYWSVTADGQPLDTKKQFYAQGFMLYGFSEYARATGSEEALQTSVELFNIIENHAWDNEFGGYIEACKRDWQPIEDMRLSAKDENFPVRILRGDNMQSPQAAGLYPCGEGAGYAGGIMSAAVDGMKCAEMILAHK